VTFVTVPPVSGPAQSAPINQIIANQAHLRRGWEEITRGSLAVAAKTFTLAVPSGYSRIRLALTGRISSLDNIGVAINELVPGSGDHHWMMSRLSATDPPVGFGGESSSFNIGQWATAVRNNAHIEFFGAGGRCSYLSDSSRRSGTTALRWRFVGSGALETPSTINALVVTTAATSFTAGNGELGTVWTLEGYRS